MDDLKHPLKFFAELKNIPFEFTDLIKSVSQDKDYISATYIE